MARYEREFILTLEDAVEYAKVRGWEVVALLFADKRNKKIGFIEVSGASDGAKEIFERSVEAAEFLDPRQ